MVHKVSIGKVGKPVKRCISAFTSHLEAWQVIIRNHFRVVYSHLEEAFLAQNDTIIGLRPATLSFGYAWNCELGIQPYVLATHSTPSSKTKSIFSVLSSCSRIFSQWREIHGKSSLSFTYRSGCNDDHWCFVSGEETGIVIFKIASLKTSAHLRKSIKLKRPVYRISFQPKSVGDHRVYHLVDALTLREAKSIAEWYYIEWLSVNQNRVAPHKRFH